METNVNYLEIFKRIKIARRLSYIAFSLFIVALIFFAASNYDNVTILFVDFDHLITSIAIIVLAFICNIISLIKFVSVNSIMKKETNHGTIFTSILNLTFIAIPFTNIYHRKNIAYIEKLCKHNEHIESNENYCDKNISAITDVDQLIKLKKQNKITQEEFEKRLKEIYEGK